MKIAVIGINHHKSLIEIREKFSFTESMKIEASNLILDKSSKEVIIISTCNRSEIYVASENIDKSIEEVKSFYEEYFKFPNAEDYIFVKKNRDAVVHLYMVSGGLDSMVLGEDQIIGQVREAMTFSMDLGFSKKVLNRLFMDAISEGKKIRSNLKISEIPLSTSYIGIKILKEEIGSLKGKKALIIGAGKMSSLAIRYLLEEEMEEIYISNRSHGRVKQLFKEFDGFNQLIAVEYSQRYEILKDVDVLITATGAPHTVIAYEDLKKTDKNLYILDLALPRDVESKVGEEENIVLYHNDDLQKLSEDNLSKRIDLSEEATEMIDEDVDKYMDWISSIKADPLIESLNKRCSSIKRDTMDYIDRKTNLNKRDKKIIDKMIMSALKQLTREPIKALKQVDEKDLEEYIKVTKKIFNV